MKVQCPRCRREQKDEGKRSSCVRCGLQPLPSYSYSRDSTFYPTPIERVLTVKAFEKQIKAKRKPKP